MTRRSTIPREIDVLPTRGAPGFLTTSGMLVLQRRSVTSSLEAGLPLGSVLVEPRSGEWLVRVSNAGGCQEIRVPDRGRAFPAAAELATRLAGSPVSPAPFIASYMHGCNAPDGSDDRIVSPLRYDPASDTIRIVRTGGCLVAFPAGSFEAAQSCAGDSVGESAWPYIERALQTGFHAADRARGDGYCKRRLTWLAGALWLEKSTVPLTCGVLTLGMEM
jgi:hypothetical protein